MSSENVIEKNTINQAEASLSAARAHLEAKRFDASVDVCDELIVFVSEADTTKIEKEKIISDALECIADVRFAQKDFHKALVELERSITVRSKSVDQTDSSLMTLFFKVEKTLGALYEMEMYHDGSIDLDKRWQAMLLLQTSERLGEGIEIESEVEIDATKAAALQKRAKKQIKKGSGKKLRERLADYIQRLLRETDLVGFIWGLGLVVTLVVGGMMTVEIGMMYKDFNELQEQEALAKTKQQSKSKTAKFSKYDETNFDVKGRHAALTPFVASDARQAIRFRSNGQAEVSIDGKKKLLPFYAQKADNYNWIRFVLLSVIRKNFYLRSCDVGLIDQDHTIYFDAKTPDFALIQSMQKVLAVMSANQSLTNKSNLSFVDPMSKASKPIIFIESEKNTPAEALADNHIQEKILANKKWQVYIVRFRGKEGSSNYLACGSDGSGRLISAGVGGSKLLLPNRDQNYANSLPSASGLMVSYGSIPLARLSGVIICGFLAAAAALVGAYSKSKKFKLPSFLLAGLFAILFILGVFNNCF